MNSYLPTSEVYTIERSYRRNKSIPTLHHLTVKVPSEGDKKYSEYNMRRVFLRREGHG